MPVGSRPSPNIWQLQSQKNIQGIIQALDTRDPVVRKRAIGALRVLKATEAVSRLRILYETEFNPEIRQLIQKALEELGGVEEKPKVEEQQNPQEAQKQALLQRLNSKESNDVIAAITELSSMSDRTVIEQLMAVFRDGKQPPEVRLAAAEALLKLNSAPASVALLGALRKEDWQVRRNAAAVLGQLEAEWCVGPLIHTMRTDANTTVRKVAAAALRRINNRAAQEALAASPMMSTGTLVTPKTETTGEALGSPSPAPISQQRHAE
jgi:HEAT repeat protein